MKIDKGIIKVLNSSPDDAFSKLKTGSRYLVKIHEKLDRNHAIVDLQGNLFKAEFLNEIPSGNMYLIYQKTVNNTLYFKLDIQENMIKSELIQQILALSVLDSDNISDKILNILIANIKKELSGLYNIKNIFHLNLLLLNLPENKNTENIVNLLNILLKNGNNLSDLIFISNILNWNSRYIQQLLLIINGQFHLKLLEFSDQEFNLKNSLKDDFNKYINNFIEIIKNNTDLDLNKTIKSILDYLFNNQKNDQNTGIQSGQVIFFEEGQFKSCKYLARSNNILLSLELTFLGIIDILITNNNSGYKIAFFCDKEETIEALKEKSSDFESIIRKKLKNSYVTFSRTKQICEKIIANNSSFNFNNIIDIKA